jgi:outer membrane protein assembly factor BamA
VFNLPDSGTLWVNGVQGYQSGSAYYVLTSGASTAGQKGTDFLPSPRLTRLEFGASVNAVDRASQLYTEYYRVSDGAYLGFDADRYIQQRGITYGAPFAAYVSDNTLFGYTAPVIGRRMRFQISPNVGNLRWVEYLADYRRYDPIIFNTLTIATRFLTSASVGRDEASFPKYIGRPDYVRGYDREQLSLNCNRQEDNPASCSAVQLLGSRVAFVNAELRFPLVRRFDLGLLPFSLPPVDGRFFSDAGMAWAAGQDVSLRRPEGYDQVTQRYPLKSYGFGVRLNLFNFALVRWDYAIPLDREPKKGYWIWTLGQSF